MATHRIPVLGWAALPDPSGDVFPQPYDVVASNDVWDRLVWTFNDTATRIGIQGGFTVPQNYVGTAKLVIRWLTTATSGDAEWDVDYRAVAVGESMDQAGTQESANNNGTAGASAHLLLETLITLTAANFAAGDEVECAIFRDGTDGGDTLAAAAHVVQVLFEYADA